MNKILYILVGIPGSGKTTLAYTLTHPDFVCSADDYMVNGDGEYVFESRKLGYVHKRCQAKCADLMTYERGPIVIANTNTTTKEMDPYILLASMYGYEVKLMEPQTTWKYNVDQCFLQGTHEVPLDKLKVMLNRLVELGDAKRYFQGIYPNLKIEVE